MSQPTTRPAYKLLAGENPDIVEELRYLFDADPQPWLDTPNPVFGGRKPRELIDTDEEIELRYWIR
jgi:hypothetical protein